MHLLTHSFALVIALTALTSLAQSEGEVIIRTRDGMSRRGRVLSETQKGYLFAGPKGTAVIAFTDIIDMKKVEVAPPVEAQPAVAPVVAALAPPPPPPSTLPSVDEVVATVPEKISREGFHFGVGANVGLRDASLIAQGQVHFDFNFGHPAYRATANFSSPAGETFVAHLDNFFHYNFGDVFSLGAGIEVGFAFGGGYSYVYVGPVIQPVIIKLGTRGQHQLSVTASMAAFSTYDYRYRGSYDGLRTLQVFGGYSYFF